MKQLLSLFLIVCLACSFAACTEDGQDQTLFYYLRTPDTIAYGEPDALIAPTPRDASPDLPLEDMLQLYLGGPADETLRNPIPKGTCLLSIIERKDMLVLVLSGEFSSLSGIQLTLAGACLTATCHELTGQERIQVRSGENIYDFDLNDFVFLDSSPGK